MNGSPLATSGIAPNDVGHVVFGQVIHTESKDMYLARVAAMGAGIPKEVPAMTINVVCGSGLKAVMLAAQQIDTGEAEIVLAGGPAAQAGLNERAPHLSAYGRDGLLVAWESSSTGGS